MPTTTVKNLSEKEIALQRLFIRLGKWTREICLGMDREICVGFTAMLAREHCLFIGPPGEGKTTLIKTIMSSVIDAKVWKKQFHPETDVDEVFSIPSAESLQAGSMERNIAGTLADCDFGFCDETNKGTESLRTALYEIMEERTYSHGPVVTQCPLNTLYGASNEIYNDVAGFTSRWLLKVNVPPVHPDTQLKIMHKENDQSAVIAIPDKDKVTMKMLQAAQISISRMRLSSDQIKLLQTMGTAINNISGAVSTRQLKKIIPIVKAYSWFSGAKTYQVETDHLEVAEFVFWQDTGDYQACVNGVESALAHAK